MWSSPGLKSVIVSALGWFRRKNELIGARTAGQRVGGMAGRENDVLAGRAGQRRHGPDPPWLKMK